MTERHCGVYFIRRSGDAAIKIGHSVDVARRICQLQTGSADDLELVGLIADAPRFVETDLKRRFELHSIRGEWFKPVPALLDLIADYPAPEHFNADRSYPERLRSMRRRTRQLLAQAAGERYSGEVPAALSGFDLPRSLPTRNGFIRFECADLRRLKRHMRVLSRRGDSGAADFYAVLCVVEPFMRSDPERWVGDVLRAMLAQERAAA